MIVLEQDISLTPAPRKRRQRGPRMTPRDLAVLQWIGEQYAVRFDQLQRLLAQESAEPEKLRNAALLSEERTRRILRRWQEAELVHYKLLLVNEKGWIWLSRRGLQFLGLDWRYYEPKPTTLQHLYYINQARFYVAERRESDVWQPERRLRAQLEARERGTIAEHLPDGIVMKPDGSKIAVEVELHSKSKNRLRAILEDLQRNYYRTWYFAPKPITALLDEVLHASFTESQRKTVQVLSLEERL